MMLSPSLAAEDAVALVPTARRASSAARRCSDGRARSEARTPANRRRPGPSTLPLPEVEPNIAASSGVMPRAFFATILAPWSARNCTTVSYPSAAATCSAVSPNPVRLTALTSPPRATAAATVSRTRLSGSTLPKSIVSIPRRLAARLDPIPAASISASTPPGPARLGSAPPATSAVMISGSRNRAASRYGVEPISVAGRFQSVVSRRIGVPFGDLQSSDWRRAPGALSPAPDRF